jgi:septum formation protein
MKKMKLILASASPRRSELLSLIQPDFEIQASGIDETIHSNESPIAYAERLATEKATSIKATNQTLILAADTIVALHQQILGKPKDPAEAIHMLTQLSHTPHHVITSVSLCTQTKIETFSVITEVTFRHLHLAEIEAYVATGCPMDKAGAYAIQGGAAPFIRSINGSYTNVVGLPLCEVSEALSRYQ